MSAVTDAAGRRERRYDPNRRARIVAACLEVIGKHGVAGTTHRKVAAAAEIPLGSMTYHFAGIGELIREAFAQFAGLVADRFERRLAVAASIEQARDAVVRIIETDVYGSARDLVLTQELYTLAARDPAVRELTHAWMARSRAALEEHFDPDTARAVDALIEGLTLHAALDLEPQNLDLVRLAVTRITTGTDTP